MRLKIGGQKFKKDHTTPQPQLRRLQLSSSEMSSYYSDYTSSSGGDSDGDEKNEYIVTIDVNTVESNRSFYAAKRSTTSNLQGKPTYAQKDLEIVASTFYAGGDDGSFRIVTKSKSPISNTNNATSAERWV